MMKRIFCCLLTCIMAIGLLPDFTVKAASAGPAALTNPAIEPSLHSSGDYVGYCDDVISNTSNLTIQWENVDADSYNVAIKVLHGAPAPGDDESGIFLYDYTTGYTKTSISLSRKQIESAAGKWIKVFVQSVYENEAYACHYYFQIEELCPGVPAALTNPAIEPSLHSSGDYVGYCDDVISNTSSLTVRWKDVDADSYNVAIKVLDGAPAPGDDESGIFLYDYTTGYTKTSISLSQKQIESAAGKWIKVFVQSVYENEDYACHYYFQVEAPEGTLMLGKTAVNLSWGRDSEGFVQITGVNDYHFNVAYELPSNINSGFNYAWLDVEDTGNSLEFTPNRANYSAFARTAVVTVTSGSESRTITVTQAACGEAAPTIELHRGRIVYADGDSIGTFTLPQEVMEVGITSSNVRKVAAYLYSSEAELLDTCITTSRISLDISNLPAGKYKIVIYASNSNTDNDYWKQSPFAGDSMTLHFWLRELTQAGSKEFASFTDAMKMVELEFSSDWSTVGKIHYVEQKLKSPADKTDYYTDANADGVVRTEGYWVNDDEAKGRCTRAAASMAWSYMGITAFPKHIVPYPASANEPYADFAKKLGCETEVDTSPTLAEFNSWYTRYADDTTGKYSPIVIHTKYGGGSGIHAFTVFGKDVNDGYYYIIDPGSDHILGKVQFTEVNGQIRVADYIDMKIGDYSKYNADYPMVKIWQYVNNNAPTNDVPDVPDTPEVPEAPAYLDTYDQYLAHYYLNFDLLNKHLSEDRLYYHSYVYNPSPVMEKAFRAWRLANLNLSDAATYSEKEMEFYQLLIFDVLNQSLSENTMLNDTQAGVQLLQSAVLDKIGEEGQIELEKLLTDPVTEDTELIDKLSTYRGLEFVGKYANAIGEGLEHTKSVSELFRKLYVLGQLSNATDEVANILADIAKNTTDGTLKVACGEVMLALRDQMSDAQIVAFFTSEHSLRKATEQLLEDVWDEICPTWLAIGQGIGKLASNLAFSIDPTVENWYSMKQLCVFESALKYCIEDYRWAYKRDASVENAKKLNKAVDMYFNTMSSGNEYAANFYESAMGQGAYNLIHRDFSDQYEAEYQNGLNSIKISKKAMDSAVKYCNNQVINLYMEELKAYNYPNADIEKVPCDVTEQDIENTINELPNDKFLLNDQSVYMNTAYTQDMLTYGNYTLHSGNVDLSGKTLTVYGNVHIKAGSFDVNGGKLIIRGNLYVEGTLHLNGGTVQVGGNVIRRNGNIAVGGGTMEVTGHQYAAETTQPACGEQGYTTYTCDCCSESYKDDYVTIISHSPGVPVAENRVEATCKTPGSYQTVIYCSNCGAVLERDTHVIEIIDHTWDQGTVTVAPTETAAGERTFACKSCGITRTESIPNLDHVHRYTETVVNSTCTEGGYTSFTCDCGDSFDDNYTSAFGHSPDAPVAENRVEATCKTAGSYQTVIYCSNCDAELERNTHVIEAVDHVWDQGTVTVAPTEAAAGEKIFACKFCGITRTESIPNLNHVHRYTETVIAPTCIEQGYTSCVCDCGDSYKVNYVAASGHGTKITMEEKQEDAGCEKAGSYDQVSYCTICGTEQERVSHAIPALGHTETIDPAVDATCTEAGLTEGKHCSVCGKILVEQTSVAMTGHTYVEGVCKVCGVTDSGWEEPADPETISITRLAGDNRFDTAFTIADALKEKLGVEKFDTIIVTYGANFPDALSGSYLAATKNAPILLSFNKKYDDMAMDYIRENLRSGGTVYLLGEKDVVSASFEDNLKGYNVKRLAGANRFETNLEVLKEAGVGDKPILVCTGLSFADSLSASAAKLPILLVWNNLTDGQRAFLDSLDGNKLYVIGGESAVSSSVAGQLTRYGQVERVAGSNRFETSVAIAETFFDAPESAVLAYAWNFPDGLCGGALAAAMDAPLILTMDKYEAKAAEYVQGKGISNGLILGGDDLISGASVATIFDR